MEEDERGMNRSDATRKMKEKHGGEHCQKELHIRFK
jgi:hypothetical protein